MNRQSLHRYLRYDLPPGIGCEWFRLHVEALGETYYDFIERRKCEENWAELSNNEKIERLEKNDRMDLVKFVIEEEEESVPVIGVQAP